MVSDGHTKWTYLPKRKRYTEGEGSADIRKSYRKPVGRTFSWPLPIYSSTAVLEKDTQLKIGSEKVPCYVVRIQTPNGANELWLGKSATLFGKAGMWTPPALKE